MGGNFNVVRRVSEKFNSLSSMRSMREFDSLTGELDLVDSNLNNARFTWSNFKECPICCRLDKFLFTNEWAAGYQCDRPPIRFTYSRKARKRKVNGTGGIEEEIGC